jgi:hypothetical protein
VMWSRKRTLITMLVVTVWFIAGESFGISKNPRISVSVTARGEADRDDGKKEVETGKGLTTTTFRTETETYTLQITIKNDENQEYQGQLEWGFVSDHSSGKLIARDPEKAVPAIFSTGKIKITLPAKATVTQTVISEPFIYEEKTVEREKLNKVNADTSSKDYITGDEYKGYIVLITENGEILAAKSNSSRYLKDEWVKKCRNPPSAKSKKKKKNKKREKESADEKGVTSANQFLEFDLSPLA